MDPKHDIDVLQAKLNAIEELGNHKYASSKDFSDLVARLSVQEEALKGLKARFDDFISSKRHITNTYLTIASLAIAILALLSHFMFK